MGLCLVPCLVGCLAEVVGNEWHAIQKARRSASHLDQIRWQLAPAERDLPMQPMLGTSACSGLKLGERLPAVKRGRGDAKGKETVVWGWVGGESTAACRINRGPVVNSGMDMTDQGDDGLAEVLDGVVEGEKLGSKGVEGLVMEPDWGNGEGGLGTEGGQADMMVLGAEEAEHEAPIDSEGTSAPLEGNEDDGELEMVEVKLPPF